MSVRDAATQYETSLGAARRRSSGAFYTPAGLVDCVLDLSLEPLLDEVVATATDDEDRVRRLLGLRICDPACGAGLFLLGAADRIAARGAPRDAVVATCLHGVDLDPDALALARDALPGADLRLGDAILGSPLEMQDRARADAWCAAYGVSQPFHWQLEVPEVFARGGFDLVVGNPPFLNQLERTTTLDSGGAALVRGLLGRLGPYTDTSAVFLRRALDLVRPGGRVAMVQPVSVLAARDARPVRDHLAEHAALKGFWISATPVFPGAAALTCAVILARDAPQEEVEVRVGPDYSDYHPTTVRDLPDAGRPWSHVAAAALGIPAVSMSTAGTLGELGEVTADFRDQYYGLASLVREGGPGFPLVTTGLIEPGRSLWGQREATFLKQRWQMPTIHPDVLQSGLGDWARRRLVPKVLVATQGRIIEAVVDEHGEWLPSVPVISLTTDRPWHVLAVLLAPPVVAHAAAHCLGAGLNLTSIKLSARQVAGLPLPADHERWNEAASLAEAGDLRAAAHAMCAAYDVEGETLVAWWQDRAREQLDPP